MSFTFNASRTRAHLYGIASNFDNAVEDCLDRLAEVAQSNAKSSRLFKNQSGALRQNIKTVKGTLERYVVADRFYSSWVENGNGSPGSYIYPVRSPVLHFWVNGREVFAKRVRASSPRPFMKQALELTMRVGPTLIYNRMTILIENAQ